MFMMIVISMLVNIAVLVPVCYGIFTGAPWAETAYGSSSPARGIVVAIYIAILIGSVGFLIKPIPAAVAALLAIQITYKVLTPFTVGTLENPVVVSNLAIAALHTVTLSLIILRPAS